MYGLEFQFVGLATIHFNTILTFDTILLDESSKNGLIYRIITNNARQSPLPPIRRVGIESWYGSKYSRGKKGAGAAHPAKALPAKAAA